MIHLLTEASELFASSLDYEKTLARITELAVPRIADWCTVDIVNAKGGIERLAVAHIDPNKVKWANEMAEKFPVDPNAPTGVPRVIRTGKSEFIRVITEEMIQAANLNDAQRKLLDELGLTSVMTVPLSARSLVLGAITFVMAESGRNFQESDLLLAEDLGRLAGLAVDNAMLYRAAQQEISVRKQTEFELRIAKEAAEASERQLAIANKAKDHFLAMLSHELRTPLTPVLATIQALQEDNTSDEIRPWLDIIQRNTELEVRLIDDLLDLTRISNGKLRLNNESTNIQELIQNVLAIYRKELAAKTIEIETHWQAKELSVDGDPTRLQQIFWNLLKNAIKFTPEKGKITVSTRSTEERITIEVEDTGIGMDSETLSHIFEPFEQGADISGRYGGLGLGLAICKLLVEAHGGTIRAESLGNGNGAKFIVELTTVRPVAIPDDTKRSGSSHKPDIQFKILLIDDHTDTNSAICMVLKRKGYHVQTAKTAAEAMLVMTANPSDLIISDIGLPDESGLLLLPKLLDIANVPAIALSGFGSDEDREKCREAGFQVHFTKPFNIVTLHETITKLLDGKDVL